MGNAGGTPFGGGSGKYNGQFGYNGMSPMNTRKRTRFSKLFLIVSLIVSVIFFLLGEVIEYNDTEKLFSIPSDKRTEDYITGRFG